MKEFERQAGEVREWDRVLVRNGQQIATLHQQVLDAQQTQAGVEKALDYFETQQKSLDQLLSHYEREIESFTTDASKPLASKLPADREREKTYGLAESLNKELDDLSRNLKSMIGEVNKLSMSSSRPAEEKEVKAENVEFEGGDPEEQLSAILGAHLRALGNIESGSAKLEGKVKELEGRVGTVEKGKYGLRR